jgi:uncharacterized protein
VGQKLYAISDLHFFTEGGVGRLPGGLVFQPIPPGLVKGWYEQVEEDAWVLIPGDISDSAPQGGMQADYQFLDELPGRKLISPGNHDGGPWRSQERIENFCRRFRSLTPLTSGHVTRLALKPDSPGLVIAAVMGGVAPGDRWFGGEPHELGPDSAKLRYQLELGRLDQALTRAREIRQAADDLLVQIHYPPWVNLRRPGAFSERIEAAGAAVCIYGHLHQETGSGFEGEQGGTQYRIVAAPRLGMVPLELGEFTESGVLWSEALRIG